MSFQVQCTTCVYKQVQHTIHTFCSTQCIAKSFTYYTVSLRAVELFGECFKFPPVGLKLMGSKELSETSAALSKRSFAGSKSLVFGLGDLRAMHVLNITLRAANEQLT